MLSICLNFHQNQARYAYKRYAYKKACYKNVLISYNSFAIVHCYNSFAFDTIFAITHLLKKHLLDYRSYCSMQIKEYWKRLLVEQNFKLKGNKQQVVPKQLSSYQNSS